MGTATAESLIQKTCKPCEGGIPALDQAEVDELLATLPGWFQTGDGRRIRREWKAKDFASAMAFLNRVAALAEEENHHPDFHLEGYRHVAIELRTHAIGGLSENDFILAAKIDRIEFPTRG